MGFHNAKEATLKSKNEYFQLASVSPNLWKIILKLLNGTYIAYKSKVIQITSILLNVFLIKYVEKGFDNK